MLNVFVCIKDGQIVEVDINVDLILDKFYKKFQEEIEAKVLRKVSSFFSLNNWEYGKNLKSIDIIKIISTISEIKSIDVNLLTNIENNSGDFIGTKYYEIVRPSNIEINFVYE
jgi:hypothetical protein